MVLILLINTIVLLIVLLLIVIKINTIILLINSINSVLYFMRYANHIPPPYIPPTFIRTYTVTPPPSYRHTPSYRAHAATHRHTIHKIYTLAFIPSHTVIPPSYRHLRQLHADTYTLLRVYTVAPPPTRTYLYHHLLSLATYNLQSTTHLRRQRSVTHAGLKALHHLRRVEHPHERVLPGIELDPVVLVLQLHLFRENKSRVF